MKSVKQLLETAESVLDNARQYSQNPEHRESLVRLADGYTRLAEAKMHALKDGFKDM